jgi:hypothetical protein
MRCSILMLEILENILHLGSGAIAPAGLLNVDGSINFALARWPSIRSVLMALWIVPWTAAVAYPSGISRRDIIEPLPFSVGRFILSTPRTDLSICISERHRRCFMSVSGFFGPAVWHKCSFRIIGRFARSTLDCGSLIGTRTSLLLLVRGFLESDIQEIADVEMSSRIKGGQGVCVEGRKPFG